LITVLSAYVAIISAIVLQLFDRRGLLLNYFGAAIGSYIFYIGVEIPDHRNLIKSVHIVQTLAEAIDAKDTYTHGHSSRVAEYAREIAHRAGYSEPVQNEIYMMGLLHDVGKIGVPDAVINKPGRLDDDEFAQIKTHPEKGAKILGSMPELVNGARWHHERFDGSGYPDGLKRLDIPEEARIIAVADAYDAMTSNRSYRRGMEQSKVREQIEKGKGTQFDPRFADIMIAMIDEDKDYSMRETYQ
jgi:putative two-component system response regulator